MRGIMYTTENPADVATRETAYKKSDFVNMWINGPKFLLQDNVNIVSTQCVSVCMTWLYNESREDCENGLTRLIEASGNLYTLKKRVAYLVAKTKGYDFQNPELNASYLDRAFVKAVQYVQSVNFGAAIEHMKRDSPDSFETFIARRQSKNANNPEDKRRVNELKTLRNLRPCVGEDLLLRVDGRLENADLPTDAKHPLILPGRHPLTRLIVLSEHVKSGHADPAYTVMKTRRRFWIIHGSGNVKYYLANCAKCSILKAKPIRQLMSDLPASRLTLCN